MYLGYDITEMFNGDAGLGEYLQKRFPRDIAVTYRGVFESAYATALDAPKMASWIMDCIQGETGPLVIMKTGEYIAARTGLIEIPAPLFSNFQRNTLTTARNAKVYRLGVALLHGYLLYGMTPGLDFGAVVFEDSLVAEPVLATFDKRLYGGRLRASTGL